jgi:DNA-nicking Smr family endonuclease
MRGKEVITAEEKLQFSRSGIQHKIVQKMRSGKITINSELDLHGLTAHQAEDIIKQFIETAISRQYRYIRIIHGKGTLILKNLLNDCLREIPEVLAFCSAIPKDGGAGAVYVLLKKID